MWSSVLPLLLCGAIDVSCVQEKNPYPVEVAYSWSSVSAPLKSLKSVFFYDLARTSDCNHDWILKWLVVTQVIGQIRAVGTSRGQIHWQRAVLDLKLPLALLCQELCSLYSLCLGCLVQIWDALPNGWLMSPVLEMQEVESWSDAEMQSRAPDCCAIPHLASPLKPRFGPGRAP